MTEMICPKCRAPLRSVERNGVTIERCVECGGVFLDRGELERLMAAENAFLRREDYGPPVRSPERAPEYRRREYDDDDDDDYEHRPPRRHRRKSFLEDLFDF